MLLGKKSGHYALLSFFFFHLSRILHYHDYWMMTKSVPAQSFLAISLNPNKLLMQIQCQCHARANMVYIYLSRRSKTCKTSSLIVAMMTEIAVDNAWYVDPLSSVRIAWDCDFRPRFWPKSPIISKQQNRKPLEPGLVASHRLISGKWPCRCALMISRRFALRFSLSWRSIIP